MFIPAFYYQFAFLDGCQINLFFFFYHICTLHKRRINKRDAKIVTFQLRDNNVCRINMKITHAEFRKQRSKINFSSPPLRSIFHRWRVVVLVCVKICAEWKGNNWFIRLIGNQPLSNLRNDNLIKTPVGIHSTYDPEMPINQAAFTISTCALHLIASYAAAWITNERFVTCKLANRCTRFTCSIFFRSHWLFELRISSRSQSFHFRFRILLQNFFQNIFRTKGREGGKWEEGKKKNR